MKNKNITQYKLIKEYGFSPGQITRLKKNSNINTHTLDMLCKILNCKWYIFILTISGIYCSDLVYA